MNAYSLETLAYEKIAQARADVARLRLLRAAEQSRRGNPRRSFPNLLRAVRGLMFARFGWFGGHAPARPVPGAAPAMGPSTDAGAPRAGVA